MRKTWFFAACVACLIVGAAFGLFWDLSKDAQSEVTYIQMEAIEDSVDVDRIFQLDKEYIVANYGGENVKIRWFESCYKMSDFLDSDPAPVVFGVANVFQVQTKVVETGGTVVNVYAVGHTKDNTTIKIAKSNFWIEDYDLFEYEDSLMTFAEAYDCLLKANCKNPHSKNVTLRWQIGPNSRNDYAPQYIFGKPDDKYFVDGRTGEVSSKNPSGVPEGDSEPYLGN